MELIKRIHRALVLEVTRLEPGQLAVFLGWLWEYAGINDPDVALYVWLESLPPDQLMFQFIILSNELARWKFRGTSQPFKTTIPGD